MRQNHLGHEVRTTLYHGLYHNRLYVKIGRLLGHLSDGLLLVSIDSLQNLVFLGELLDHQQYG